MDFTIQFRPENGDNWETRYPRSLDESKETFHRVAGREKRAGELILFLGSKPVVRATLPLLESSIPQPIEPKEPS